MNMNHPPWATFHRTSVTVRICNGNSSSLGFCWFASDSKFDPAGYGRPVSKLKLVPVGEGSNHPGAWPVSSPITEVLVVKNNRQPVPRSQSLAPPTTRVSGGAMDMAWGLTGTKVPGPSLHRTLGTMTVNKVSLWWVGWGTVEGHLHLPHGYHRKFVSKCQLGPRVHHANKVHANRKEGHREDLHYRIPCDFAGMSHSVLYAPPSGGRQGWNKAMNPEWPP